MDKKLLYWAVALSCVLLLMPAQMRAQAGLQTDTDGSVTGTAGTEYLWVNAANFPDDEFRAYMLTIAKTTGGQSYVVPADVTHLDMSAPCCENGNSVGEILSSKWDFCHYSWEGGKTNNYEPVPSPCIEQINAFFQDPQNVEEVQNHFYGEYDKINYVIRKHQQTVVSTVEVSNGMHRVLKKDIVFYRAEMNIAVADDYYVYDSERVLYRDFAFSESGETLHSEHNYYQPSGDIADLTGIEHFANLQSLDCSNNRLTSLNLTSSLSELRRLNCAQNQLTSLDLTALAKLDSLDCSNNRLTDLKVNLVAHAFSDYQPWNSSYYGETNTNAHQRVYLNCSYNYLTNLNNISVHPSVEGQLVNFDGDYSNNRILGFPQYKHPYYDLQYGGLHLMSDKPSWADEPLQIPSSCINNNQRDLFNRLGVLINSNYVLYLHSYNVRIGGDVEDWYLLDLFSKKNPSFYRHSLQNIGLNLSIINRERTQVGVPVSENLYDNEEMFASVALLENTYPAKMKQGNRTYYLYDTAEVTQDLDYCHHKQPVAYSLFSGYASLLGENSQELRKILTSNISSYNINKFADMFDYNIVPQNGLAFVSGHGGYSYHSLQSTHDVQLTADHYVMYVNPISEDAEGLCNGTVVLDYDAIIPEGMEAFIVTSYTAGGESDRFKTGRLNLVKVGDGDGANGYKRVIPANNPVCLRTKQTVGEGQAADKMSTTGLYPFHRNNDRTLYPCPDPNDAQYEPLELIPSALFDGNKLRGVLDVAGQSYTAGDVLTLGRYKDNNEHKIGFWTYNGAKLNMHRVYVLKSELNIPSAAKGCTLDFGYDSTPTGIGSVGSESRVIDNGWYTLQGVRLSGKPAQSGIYIHNGKKVVVDSGNVTESGSSPTAQEEVYTDNF